MSTNLKIAVNCDTQDQPFGESGVDWEEMNLQNDYIIFSKGSDIVKDGESLPSSSDLNQAGVLITNEKQVVPKYFLADYSEDELKEINNAGNNNKRYVFAFDFDGETASEPVLEVWDDTEMDSVDSVSLGEGVPSSSWIWGITTTESLPGSGWEETDPTVGSRLAGSSAGHFLWLNDNQGALDAAKTLYCNLQIVIPANVPQAGFEQPLFVIKFASN